MAPTLDQLRTFVRVAELKSFSAAADEAGLARGIVSKRIAQLEAVIGQALLRRSTRSVALTPAGELLVETLRRALNDIELGFVAVQGLRSTPSGVLRITAPVSWGQRCLCPLVPEFLARHPAIEIELVLEDGLTDLGGERFDVGFRMTAAPDASLVALAVATLDRRLYASAAYLQRMGVPSHPDDLASHPVMAYWRPSWHEPLRFERAGQAVSVAVRSRYRVNSAEAVLAAVLADGFIGVLPTYVCQAELARGLLQPVLPRWQVKSRFGERIFAIGTPDRMRLARCRALVDFVRERLAGAQGLAPNPASPSAA